MNVRLYMNARMHLNARLPIGKNLHAYENLQPHAKYCYFTWMLMYELGKVLTKMKSPVIYKTLSILLAVKKDQRSKIVP